MSSVRSVLMNYAIVIEYVGEIGHFAKSISFATTSTRPQP